MDRSAFEPITEKLNFASMGKPALVGALLLVVVVAVAAGRIMVGAATADTFEVVSTSAHAATSAESVSSSNSLSSDDDGAAKSLFVHVAGCVRNPGLVELPQGARVADAVQAAGGFSEEARSDSVNLARSVQDGEQVVVLSANDADQVQGEPNAAADSGQSSGGSLVNINKASASELQQLPGIGAATAQKIVDDRYANGPFASCEDLKRVSGIGDKKYEALSGLICV